MAHLLFSHPKNGSCLRAPSLVASLPKPNPLLSAKLRTVPLNVLSASANSLTLQSSKRKLLPMKQPKSTVASRFKRSPKSYEPRTTLCAKKFRHGRKSLLKSRSTSFRQRLTEADFQALRQATDLAQDARLQRTNVRQLYPKEAF